MPLPMHTALQSKSISFYGPERQADIAGVQSFQGMVTSKVSWKRGVGELP